MFPLLKYTLQNGFKKALGIFLIICCSIGVNAQQSKIDSLVKAFNAAKYDSTRFNNLLDQIGFYRLNDMKKAREKVIELNVYARKINEKKFLASGIFHSAVQFRKEGNYDSSIVYYLQAIKIFEEIKSEMQVTMCYASLGIAYWQLKEFEPALRFFRKAEYLINKQGKPERILANYINIAGVYFDLKQFDSALVYLNKSKYYAESINDTASLADVYGNMGSVYLLMNDTANGMRLSMIGAEYAIKTDYKYQLFTSYANIGTVYLKRKNYKEAERYFVMSLEIANLLGAMEGRKGNYKDLAEVYKQTGDFEKAFNYIEKYIQVNDSLLNEARMKQVTGLEAKYQSEKKDKELMKEKVASEKKTVITYALSVGLLLFLVLAFFAFRGYLNKKKYASIIETANHEIKTKSSELASRNKDVTDSINYAKRIQYAILPNDDAIYKAFPQSFIFYKPKDIVSGDFYWFHEINNNEFILACGDCTGHGVPGAFMTVIGSNLLNQIVIEKKVYNPARILSEIDMLLNTTLKQDYEATKGVQDGMDMALIKVNTAKKEYVITSAKRPVVLIRDNQLVETKGSKFSVGGMRSGNKEFAEHVTTYKAGDQLYMFTDGFCDQFGGDKGKKFSSKRLKELLLENHKLPLEEQKLKLENSISDWRGQLEQVDDVLVMGIKFL